MSNDRKYPYWMEKIDEELKEPIYNIIGACQNVCDLEKKYRDTQSDGDEKDLKAARQDLSDILLEVYDSNDDNKRQSKNSLLWDAIMQIRPRIIGKRMNAFFNQHIITGLFKLRDEARAAGGTERANDFGKLGGQLIYVNLARGWINGDVVVQKGADGKKTNHYPPGIPVKIKNQLGIKNTTKKENWPKIRKAYEIMCGQTIGAAREAMEGHLKDLNEILQDREEKYNNRTQKAESK